MIRKVIIGLMLTGAANAATFQDAQSVYNKLAKANSITHPPRLVMVRTREVNADYNGQVIHINSGMLSFVQNMDELALILGHELGHYVDRNKNQTNYQSEYAADAHGSQFEARAGFNRCNGALVLYRFHDSASYSHPDSTLRYNRIKC